MGDHTFPPGHTRVTEYRVTGTERHPFRTHGLTRSEAVALMNMRRRFGEPAVIEQRTVLTTPWTRERTEE